MTVRQCCMRDGHGAVTVGSEIAAGVKDVHIRDCMFMNTDRGLRVKTRRGRGKLSVLDDISFENIDMDNVMTPFVVNSFYFCDPMERQSMLALESRFLLMTEHLQLRVLHLRISMRKTAMLQVHIYSVCQRVKLRSLHLRILTSAMLKMQSRV